jgi:hypothetical protein
MVALHCQKHMVIDGILSTVVYQIGDFQREKKRVQNVNKEGAFYMTRCSP